MPETDVKSEFAEAPIEALDAALKVAKHRAPAGTGFRSPRKVEKPRAGEAEANAANLYKALRERYGLDGSKTPDAFRKNDRKVML